MFRVLTDLPLDTVLRHSWQHCFLFKKLSCHIPKVVLSGCFYFHSQWLAELPASSLKRSLQLELQLELGAAAKVDKCRNVGTAFRFACLLGWKKKQQLAVKVK